MMRGGESSTSEYLRYALRHDETVLLLKPNGFMSGYHFEARSFLGSSWERLAGIADDLATAVGALDNQWCVHVEALRTPGARYPTTGAWPSPGLYFLDQVRRFRFEEEGRHYSVDGRLWLSYYPRRPRTSWWADLTGRSAEFLSGPFQKFCEDRLSVEAALVQYLLAVERMDVRPSDDAGIMVDPAFRALRECMLGESGEIASDVSEPIFADGVIAERIEKGDLLRVGSKYVSVYSVWGYPRYLFPAMLTALNGVQGTLRFGIRIMPLSMPQAEHTFAGLSRVHALSSLGPNLFAARGVQEDVNGSSWRGDAQYGKDLAGGGEVFATVYCYVVCYADSEAESAEQDQAVEQALRAARVVFRREQDPNNFDAFLASLPGEIDANDVRVGRMTTAGALRVAPLVSTYQGPKVHPHPRYGRSARPLVMMTTRSREPYRFFHHVGEVGHTLFIAPTGVGKSYWLRTMESAHLAAYEGARVLALDIGYSAFKLPLFVGGSHYVASLSEGPQIAFLDGLDDPTQFEEIVQTVIEATESWLKRDLLPKQAHDIRASLDVLIGKEACLSDLGSVCQDEDLRDLYSGLRGTFLDARQDGFSFDAAIPYWVFEYGALRSGGAGRWTTPFFMHVQRRFWAFLDRLENRPTLLTFDEAGEGFKIRRAERFAEVAEREGRKHMLSFVFACQSTMEVLNSSIRDVLITQTKTKMCGSIPEARSPRVREQLEQIGFSDDAIQEIGRLGQREILIENEHGTQVTSLQPTPVELALCGNASNDDRDLIRDLVHIHGPNDWVIPYLETYGEQMAPYVQSYRALVSGGT